MTRYVLAAMLALVCASARADVRVEEKSSAKFEGLLGKALNRGSEKGQLRTVAVKQDRKLTLDENTGELIDLQEEKIYRLDRKKKTYEVVTFAELRREMEGTARDASPSDDDDAEAGPEEPDRHEVDIEVTETGKQKNLNGFDSREYIVTVTIHRKGMTLEQGGGTVITADTWLTPDVKAGNEIAEFDRRFVKKVYGIDAPALSQAALAALTSGPGTGEGLEKLRQETDKLKGYPVLVTTTFEKVKKPQAAAEAPTSASGLGGFFAKKVANKVANRGGPRSTFFTMTSEVLSVSTSVASADVALPAGYAARKKND